MNPLLIPKFVPLINAQLLVDDAYWAGSHQHGSINTTFDRRLGVNGMVDYFSIVFQLGATDIAVAELSLYESVDDTTYTIVSASNYATAPATLPSATADGTAVAWHVDGRARARYFRVNAKGGNGSVGAYAYAFALAWPQQWPNSVSERGYAQELYVA